MAREFYCEVKGEVFGPFEATELRRMAQAGQIARTDRIRRGGEGQWVEALKVKGLFEERATSASDSGVGEPSAPAGPPARPRPPAPPSVVAAQAAQIPATVPAASHAAALQAVPYAAPTAVQVNVSTSKAAHSLGIGSVILGILGLFTICIPFIGLPLSALGLCLGIAGIAMAAVRKGSGIGFSIAGTAVSSLVLLPGALFWFAFGSAVSSLSEQASEAAANARATNQVAVVPAKLSPASEEHQTNGANGDSIPPTAKSNASPTWP